MKPWTSRPLQGLAAALICLAVPAPGQTFEPHIDVLESTLSVDRDIGSSGRVVILVNGGDVDQALSDLRTAMSSDGLSVSQITGGVAVEFSQPVSRSVIDAAIDAAQSSDGVVLAERDQWRTPITVPNDPLVSALWSLGDVEDGESVEGLGIKDAWNVTTGSDETVVAVVDTGVLSHPDIAARLLPGADMISSPTISQDGDGRDGDNTDEGDSCFGTPSSWHGLHVSGIVGASADNGIGVAGIDWQSRVLAVRALGTCGGWASDIADGIRWAAGLPVPGVPINPMPAKVINLSLGSAGPCMAIEQSAIDAAVAARLPSSSLPPAISHQTSTSRRLPLHPATTSSPWGRRRGSVIEPTTPTTARSSTSRRQGASSSRRSRRRSCRCRTLGRPLRTSLMPDGPTRTSRARAWQRHTCPVWSR